MPAKPAMVDTPTTARPEADAGSATKPEAPFERKTTATAVKSATGMGNRSDTPTAPVTGETPKPKVVEAAKGPAERMVERRSADLPAQNASAGKAEPSNDPVSSAGGERESGPTSADSAADDKARATRRRRGGGRTRKKTAARQSSDTPASATGDAGQKPVANPTVEPAKAEPATASPPVKDSAAPTPAATKAGPAPKPEAPVVAAQAMPAEPSGSAPTLPKTDRRDEAASSPPRNKDNAGKDNPSTV